MIKTNEWIPLLLRNIKAYASAQMKSKINNFTFILIMLIKMMLDYKLLEALEAVIREGGFDKGARALFLTQSAVSQRIKLLEDQTGQVLLIRTTPPRLTSAGKRVLKHFLQVRQLEHDLADDLSPEHEAGFVSLSIGLNADSLATWFMEAVRPFIERHRAVIDLRMDDQDQTHQFLRDGEVLGCISSRKKAVQGCTSTYLGSENYRLLAASGFAEKWFPHGLNRESIRHAPAVIFNRKDELHNLMLQKLFKKDIPAAAAHYVPSSEKFAWMIASGLAYGMAPDLQSAEMIRNSGVINLAPDVHIPVALYWHCWKIHSELIDDLTKCLAEGAGLLLSA